MLDWKSLFQESLALLLTQRPVMPNINILKFQCSRPENMVRSLAGETRLGMFVENGRAKHLVFCEALDVASNSFQIQAQPSIKLLYFFQHPLLLRMLFKCLQAKRVKMLHVILGPIELKPLNSAGSILFARYSCIWGTARRKFMRDEESMRKMMKL